MDELISQRRRARERARRFARQRLPGLQPLAAAIALMIGAPAARAAPPPDDTQEPVALLTTSSPLLPTGGTGCHGITTSPRGLSLCDQQTHTLPDATIPQTTWDVVRVGYGTTATFNDYDIVAELPTAGAGFFSPVTVFSGPDGAYAVATGTFNNAVMYMAPQSLANVIATTGGVLVVNGGTIGLNPINTYSPTMTLAALTAFGGGTVNANGVMVDLPSTLATAFQITNGDPGGGLPGQRTLAQINATNMRITLGDGNPGGSRTRGALVGGEAELNLTDSTIDAGNYSLGIYNYFAGTYTGAIDGSRSNLLRSDITLGNESVGWWGNGTLAPARLTATDSSFSVGSDSWGIYMVAGTNAHLVDSTITAGPGSYGALMHDGGTLTLDGASAIRATGADSIGIENDGSHVVFGTGTPEVEGGALGLSGLAGAGFQLQSGSTLRVSSAQDAAIGIQLDGSGFDGVSGSTLQVAMGGATGTGIHVLNAGHLNQAGSVALTSPGSAVSVSGAGSQVTLSGGGTAASSAAGAPAILVDEGAGFTANALATSASGSSAAALGFTGAGATVDFSGGSLSNASGGTLQVTGTGAVGTFADTQVGGSGQWLDLAADPVSGGSADGTLTFTGSTLTGSAQTAAGSTSNVTLVESTWFLTGSSVLTSLVNDPSVIDFAPPTGDPSLASSYHTLTVNQYAGDGRLVMNTWLAGDDSPSDRLVIVDGNGSGPGTIQVRGTGGGGTLTTGLGITLVEAINSTTATDTFALAGPVVAGPYEYFLYRGGPGGSATADVQNSWYLRSTLDCSAPGAPSPPCPAPPTPPPPPPPPPPPGPPPPPPPPPPPGPPPPPPPPAYRQEVSLAASLPVMSAIYGRTLVDTMHERIGDPQLLANRQDLAAGDGGMNGAWVRVLHHDGERDGGDDGIYGRRGASFDYRFSALQVGLDLFRRIAEDGARQHAGGYLAYGRATGQIRHNFLDHDFHAGEDEFRARTIGAYWTGFNARGAYLDAVGQYTWYDLKTQSTRLPESFTNGDGIALSLEAGWPFALSRGDTVGADTGWKLEPQAQVIWQSIDIDDLVDEAARVRYRNGESTAGRLGARLNRSSLGTGRAGQARASDWWLRANVWHEFSSKPRTEFSSAGGYVPFVADLGDTWGEVGVGGTWQVSATGYLYADLDYTWSFDGEETSWNGKVGMRWNW